MKSTPPNAPNPSLGAGGADAGGAGGPVDPEPGGTGLDAGLERLAMEGEGALALCCVELDAGVAGEGPRGPADPEDEGGAVWGELATPSVLG